jgi:hypothetical protein
VGKDLTVRLDTPAQDRSRLPARPIDRVAWRESVKPSAVETAAEAPALAAQSVVDVDWSQAVVDPERVIATLRAERTHINGGFNHPHTAVGCVFCRRAAAAYR